MRCRTDDGVTSQIILLCVHGKSLSSRFFGIRLSETRCLKYRFEFTMSFPLPWRLSIVFPLIDEVLQRLFLSNEDSFFAGSGTRAFRR